MSDTGGDWTRRHARLGATGEAAHSADAAGRDRDAGATERVVRAEPPADDWTARHAWCRRA